MWRFPVTSQVFRRAFAGVITGAPVLGQRPERQLQQCPVRSWAYLCSSLYSTSGNGNGETENGVGAAPKTMTLAETKRLMRLANVEALKRRLEMEGEEVIGYTKLLEACEVMGVARNKEEAEAFARVLDDAGVVLLFRDRVYLHTDKLVDLVRRAVPLGLTSDSDPRHDELKKLQKKKDEIDMLAHKQVRRFLWSGLGFFVMQIGLFFRLTFWEFSWDVMEPVAFFTTTAGILVGYGYFLVTSKDPTYQDLMKRLFLSRQRKLFQRERFDIEKFTELQRYCKSPFERQAGVMGVDNTDQHFLGR